MFIVAWDGHPPPDKAEWIRILREVLAGEVGSYRVVFRKHKGGWRFSIEWQEDGEAGEDVLVSNTPESVGYNLYVSLTGGGMPLDPTWRPRTKDGASGD